MFFTNGKEPTEASAAEPAWQISGFKILSEKFKSPLYPKSVPHGMDGSRG